jgi:hypothetical protein
MTNNEILWTDWVPHRLESLEEYMKLLMEFVRSRFDGRDVEMLALYQGPGTYRLKYWYKRPDDRPPLVKLEWEAPV